jgi:hypothetical protein
MQILTIAMERDILHFEYDGVDLMAPFSLFIFAYNSTCVGGPSQFIFLHVAFSSIQSINVECVSLLKQLAIAPRK